RLCFEFCVFQPFEFVSNFGFRALSFFVLTRSVPSTLLTRCFAWVMVFPKPSPCRLRLAVHPRFPTTAWCKNSNRAFPYCADAVGPPNTPPLFGRASRSGARFGRPDRRLRRCCG